MNPYAGIYLLTADEYRRTKIRDDFRASQRNWASPEFVADRPHRLAAVVRSIRSIGASRRARVRAGAQTTGPHAA